MFEVIYDRIKHGTISVFPMIRGEISESVYIDKLQETFPSLSDNDCSDILQQHACKIEEIIFVYWDFETAVKALAEVGGYVDDNNKKYFDFRAFGKDLRTSRNCIELTSGRILFVKLRNEWIFEGAYINKEALLNLIRAIPTNPNTISLRVDIICKIEGAFSVNLSEEDITKALKKEAQKHNVEK